MPENGKVGLRTDTAKLNTPTTHGTKAIGATVDLVALDGDGGPFIVKYLISLLWLTTKREGMLYDVTSVV